MTAIASGASPESTSSAPSAKPARWAAYATSRAGTERRAASWLAAPRRYDYEYHRNSTVNLFVFLDARRPWRKVKVTDRRTALDLSSHITGALYEAFPAPEAHRILRRLEFHYTPRHASWLNMAEIESGVLRGQCLDRRIGERKLLVSQIAA